MSWIGPVFDFELLTTSRRARYYAIRSIYGLVILFMVWTVYQSYNYIRADGTTELSIYEMSMFSNATFASFAWIQFLLAVLMTPAIVAGTIADEKQRKTLLYLLASQLTSTEIILGKLAARLLNVLILMLLGLPILSLLTLFGGVDPLLVLLVYAETICCVYFLGTFSMWVSVQAKKPREAVTLMYMVTVIWGIGFQIVYLTMPSSVEPWKTIWSYIEPGFEWVAICSPSYLFNPRSFGRGATWLVTPLFWVMGTQLLYGTILLMLAILQLRPTYQKQGESSQRIVKLKRALLGKRSWLPRPTCGDNAMYWKELHVARSGGLSKVTGLILFLGMTGLIIYVGWDVTRDAFGEVVSWGWFHPTMRATEELNEFVRATTGCVYVIWLLAIGASSAGVLASEREEDTWITLISTPLEKRDILIPKLVGSIWAMKPIALLILCLWLVGACLKGIHPVGLLLGLFEFTIFTWFTAVLGLNYSLLCKNSARAQSWTLLTLIVLNGAYMFCCIPFRPDSPMIALGSTPFVLVISLMSWEDVRDVFSSVTNRSLRREFPEYALLVTLCIAAYGLAASLLSLHVWQSFDRSAGRPSRIREQ